VNNTCINKYKSGHSPISRDVFINNQADVAIARRITLHIAEQAGFNQRLCAKISIIISEIGTNLVKHTKEGGLLKINLSFLNHIPFLTIASFDKGPGITSIKKAMVDGISATNTLGTGLGAIYRLSNRVAICSNKDVSKPCPFIFDKKDWSTILVCQIWDEENPLPLIVDELDFSCLLEPMEGNSICGDAVHMVSTPFFTRIMLMDGSGRGNGAAEAVCKAIKVLDRIPAEMPLNYVIDTLESPLSDTQGMSMLILKFDHRSKKLHIYGNGSLKLILGLDDNLHYFLHVSDFLKLREPIDVINYNSVFAITYTDGVGRISTFRDNDMLKDISSLIWTQLLFKHNNIKDDAAMLVVKWKI